MNSGRKHRGRFVAVMVSLLLLSAVLFLPGCEGPQGPKGKSIGSLDLYPPEITLLSPVPGDTVFADTLTLRAVASDNRGVAFVQFYIDGTSRISDDSTAVDSFPSSGEYRVTWDFPASGLASGLHLLTARAFDTEHNLADTPPIPIWHLPPTGLREIGYDGTGVEGEFGLPDGYGDRYFNVRFTPLKSCALKEIRFEFRNPAEAIPPLAGGVDIRVFVWTSADLVPDQLLDSLTITEEEIIYDHWMSVDVSDWNLSFSGDFHAGYSPLSELYDTYQSENRAAPIVINADPTLLEDARQHRSGEYEAEGQARGWGSFQEHWEVKWDFHIRALVDYGNGETALLAP